MDRSIAKRGRSRVFATAAATVILTIAAVFVTPGNAHAAGTFRWKADTSGNWNDPSKWTLISGDVGAGFPNGPGDIARINLLFTISRTITIPAGVSITIGTLSSGASPGLVIKAGGAGARLVFESGSANNAELFKFGDAGIDVEVPVVMKSRLAIYTELGDAVKFRSPISAEPQAIGIEKSGSGGVVFEAANTFTGMTNVNDGALVLQSQSGPSLPGSLTIGDNVGSGQSAAVFVEYSEQIGLFDGDADVVTVNADGNLTVHKFYDNIGKVNIRDGVVRLNAGGIFAHAVDMIGGVVYADNESTLIAEGDVVARSSTLGPARIEGAESGRVYARGPVRTFNVADGPAEIDLDVSIPIMCSLSETTALVKAGAGTLRLRSAGNNDYRGETWVKQGRLDVASPSGVTQFNALRIGDGAGPAVVSITGNRVINAGEPVTIGVNGTLLVNAAQDLGTVTINGGGELGIDGGEVTAKFLSMNGSRVTLGANGAMTVRGDLTAASSMGRPASIEGDGVFKFDGGERVLTITDGPQPIDLRINAHLVSGTTPGRLRKRGFGAIELAGLNSRSDALVVEEGALLVTGSYAAGPIALAAGTTLGGTGTVGAVDAPGAKVAPGLSRGTLKTGSIAFNSSSTFPIEIGGTTAGTGYDTLIVKGSVTLNGAELVIDNPSGYAPSPGAPFTIIDNDGTDPVIGTFAGYAEGAQVVTGQRRLSISYRGGDGNDVILADTSVLSYFLAEGATGAFFDDDVLIANPNESEAPITLTFLREGGRTVIEKRTIAAQSRMTVHVDRLAGLEDASVSVQVTSENNLPLVVERSMFWDASYYGGHTANAVERPETRWIFAEGFQGFFDTYILIANANAEATTATLTFLRENDTPVSKTVEVLPFARKTIYAGDYDELKGRAFGIVVDATKPVIAERAMYFASAPGRLWSGGHVNTGTTAPSTSWFHAEGATGDYFSTFILLSNPQDTEAHVDLRFLLATGEVITRTKTIDAKQRVTINPAMEGDPRLENAAVSTVVQSDVPIVSERSMYWNGEAASLGEGHNSSGVVSTTRRSGLAEGRIGGPHGFDTFILLANPSTTEAQVQITYLREGGGAPIVKTYTVPGTSRYNVDVKTVVPELRESSFGAVVEVMNDVAIAVERSLYWNALDVFWAGGSNALGTPLPMK